MNQGLTIGIIGGILLIIIILANALSPVPNEFSRDGEEEIIFGAIDPLGDVLACGRDLGRADQEIARASNSVDIARVEMSIQDNDLIGVIEVTGPIPDTFAEPGQEDYRETNMFIDVDGDRVVDYLISLGTAQDSSEMFLIRDLVDNQIQQFPGEFRLTTNTHEFQIPIETIGSNREFNWYVSTTWKLVAFEVGESIVELTDIFPDPEQTVLGPCTDLFIGTGYHNWASLR